MVPHIQQTIRDLEDLVAKLNASIDCLRLIDDYELPATLTGPVTHELVPLKPKTKRAAPAPAKVDLSKRGAALELVQKCLPESFTCQDVVNITGLKTQRASTKLWAWKEKGLIKKGEGASWVKTAKFPGAAATAPAAGDRLHIPGIDKPELSPQEQYDEALKQRDRARAAGNETLERISQDKADMLARKFKLA